MRRLTGLVLPALLALALLAAPAAAVADEGAGDDALLLAAEAEGEDAGAGGPEPAPHDAEENLARELGGYDELETPFTWGAAFLMLFLGVVGVTLLAGLYWLLVHRPRKQQQGT